MGKISLPPSSYPTVRRDAEVVEVLHGVSIPDPYRWLEDPDAEDTKAFVDAQNAVTKDVLAQCSTRANFAELFADLYDYEKVSLPSKKGERYFYTRNTGLQAQSVVYSTAALGEEGVVFLDPNTLSEDGTVALAGWAFSEEGDKLAYMISSGGSDWRTVKVARVDAATGARVDLPDTLEHVKFSSLAWTHDGLGFFYNSYAPPDTRDAGTETGKNQHQQLRFHALGTPQADDPTVLACPDHPDWMMGAEVSHDGRYLIVSISAGCEPTNKLYAASLEALPRSAATGAVDFSWHDFHKGSTPLPVIKIVDDFRASYDYLGSSEDGAEWTLMTNLDAPRYRVLRVDVTASPLPPPESWAPLIEQHPKDLLQWCSLLAGGVLAVCYLRDVKGELQLRDFATGALVAELPMPGVGSVGGFSGSRKRPEFFFSLTGFTDPGSQYRCDASRPGDAPELFRRVATKFDPDALVTRQVFVTSKDGTQVPMFLVHARDYAPRGDSPTLLYGYGEAAPPLSSPPHPAGAARLPRPRVSLRPAHHRPAHSILAGGFNISLEPSFSVSRVAWLLGYGGVVAVANLRGGGEYGVEWRNAGSLGRKQNTFDDFQACATWLHANKYCSPATLAIQGGSNGGLLVGACVNQRPDLYACALAQVGVLDLLRFKLFTIGHAWVSAARLFERASAEHHRASFFDRLSVVGVFLNVQVSDYGDVAVEDDFRWLLAYSPLHNVARPVGGTQQYASFPCSLRPRNCCQTRRRASPCCKPSHSLTRQHPMP